MKDHICINLNNIDNEVYCDFIVMLTSFQTISSINYDITKPCEIINNSWRKHKRNHERVKEFVYLIQNHVDLHTF
jgi:hypothetical protein